MKDQEETDTKRNEFYVKLNRFWRAKPAVWFAQAEAQFDLAGVNEESRKFSYLVAQLELSVLEKVYDIVSSADENKYTLAKERLLQAFEKKENQPVKENNDKETDDANTSANDVEIVDTKPSSLLATLKEEGGRSDEELKKMWLDKLPTEIQNILAISQDDLERLVEIADKIWELISSFNQRASGTDENSKGLESRGRNRRYQNTKFRYNRRFPPKVKHIGNNRVVRVRYDPNGKYCYAHFFYGHKLKKDSLCEPGCQWKVRKEGKAGEGSNSMETQEGQPADGQGDNKPMETEEQANAEQRLDGNSMEVSDPTAPQA